MSDKQTDKSKIRDYLLGNTSPTDEKFEERLMTDDDFFQKFQIQEEELIQDYADENLTDQEKQQFERHFLISKERKEAVFFAKSLRKHVSQAELQTESNAKTLKPEKPKQSTFFSSFFSSPIPVAACLLIIAGLSGYIAWNNFLTPSDNEIALASLNKAFDECPLESLISGIQCKPKRKIRGEEDSKVDKIALAYAESKILGGADKKPNAETLHTLGKLYLAKKEFDNAIDQLEKAENLDNKNAQIKNDLGVAYYEKRQSLNNGDSESLILKDKALEQFNSAIKEKPEFPEALFNKAITIQKDTPDLSIQVWEEFLKIDSTSVWADEARQRIKKLKLINSKEKTTNEVKQNYLEAYKKKDSSKAFGLLSDNRELIRDNNLFQNLIFEYITAENEDKKLLLNALKYAGEIEKEQTGDLFSHKLASYYSDFGKSKEFELKQALSKMRKGFDFCLKVDFDKAKKEFEDAKKLFVSSNNLLEAKLAEHFVAYCLFNKGEIDEASVLWKIGEEFGRENNYKWLQANNLYWLGGYQRRQEKLTLSTNTFEKGLEVSKEIKDPYMIQRFLINLAKQNAQFGKRKKTLNYLQELFQSSSNTSSLRQKCRNLYQSLPILAKFEYYDLAMSIANESILNSKKTDDPICLSESLSQAGIAYYNTGDFETGRQLLSKASIKNIDIDSDYVKDFLSGRATLVLAHLERKAQNYEKSVNHYDEALKIFGKLENQPYQFETQKGKLLSFQKLKKDFELEKQISIAIETAEKYRTEIFEEQQQTAFFDSAQTIYDIAIEYEFRENNFEKAYNYAEKSNSRSLLSWLSNGAKIMNNNNRVKILLNDKTEPLTLKEIRSQIPKDVQILQYSVLDDEVLIWLISNEDFQVVSSKVNVDELNNKVISYLNLLPEMDITSKSKLQSLSRDLYDILIAPVANKLKENNQICIIPSKVLFHLPFNALTSPDGKFLIIKYPISYSPSSNVFLLSTENASKKNNANLESLLAIGNPTFDKKEYSLDDLPNAQMEAETIDKLYSQSKIFVNEKATKKVFLESLQDIEILHFAGHYVVNQDSPLSSKLLFAKSGNEIKDSSLSNAELINIKIPKMKMVILSACDTGIENYYKGEGLIGLSRTFLTAGVPIVVGSQWKVDSDPTNELMQKFHKFRQDERLSTARALRKAQIEMISSENVQFQHPYNWSGFAVFGGYSIY